MSPTVVLHFPRSRACLLVHWSRCEAEVDPHCEFPGCHALRTSQRAHSRSCRLRPLGQCVVCNTMAVLYISPFAVVSCQEHPNCVQFVLCRGCFEDVEKWTLEEERAAKRRRARKLKRKRLLRRERATQPKVASA